MNALLTVVRVVPNGVTFPTQTLQFDQHAADLLKTAFGDVDDLLGALGVVHGRVDRDLFGAKILAGDEAGGIIRTADDAKTRRKTVEGLGKIHVLLAEDALGDH